MKCTAPQSHSAMMRIGPGRRRTLLAALALTLVVACEGASAGASRASALDPDVRRRTDPPAAEGDALYPSGDGLPPRSAEDVSEPGDRDAPPPPEVEDPRPRRPWLHPCSLDEGSRACREAPPGLVCMDLGSIDASLEGPVCSRACSHSEDCPSGHVCVLLSALHDVALCFPGHRNGDPLCSPCTDDAPCGLGGCHGLARDHSHRCLPPCEAPRDCPLGFRCAHGLCWPPEDTCSACQDADGDGYGEGPGCFGPDCDDGDPEVFPGAPERCDDRDWSCSGDPLDDLLHSEEHCGACGLRCPTAAPPVASVLCLQHAEGELPRCTATCAPGWASCDPAGPACGTSLHNEPEHCGGCGRWCRPGPGDRRVRCVEGRCIAESCKRGWARCGHAERCTTELGQVGACASCEDRCSARVGYVAACEGEACVEHLLCPSPLTPCDDQCANLAVDADHCGACGAACPALGRLTAAPLAGGRQHQRCLGGQCQCTPGAGAHLSVGSPATCNLMDTTCNGAPDSGCPRYALDSLQVFEALESGDVERLVGGGHGWTDPQAALPLLRDGRLAHDDVMERLLRWHAADARGHLRCPSGHSVSGVEVLTDERAGVLGLRQRCRPWGIRVNHATLSGQPLGLELGWFGAEVTSQAIGADAIRGVTSQPPWRHLACAEEEVPVGLDVSFHSGEGVRTIALQCRHAVLHFGAIAGWSIAWSGMRRSLDAGHRDGPPRDAHLRSTPRGQGLWTATRFGARAGTWSGEPGSARVQYLHAMGEPLPEAPPLIPDTWRW